MREILRFDFGDVVAIDRGADEQTKVVFVNGSEVIAAGGGMGSDR